MKLDLEGGTRGYTGLGDLVLVAWLAAGRRDHIDPISIHRTRNLDLAALLGLDVDPVPGGVRLDSAYDRELADRGRRPRVEYLQEFLALTSPIARPPLHIPPVDTDWADGVAREVGGPPVVICPQTAWRSREWPANYWVDLAWTLRNAGHPVVVCLPADDERFRNTPRRWWGLSIGRLAALLAKARVVVGGDSFPAHLAGTAGTPTLALMGPTRPTVFAHLPAVRCVSSRTPECTGCHFGPPFRAACDQGCLALYRLFPEAVATAALELITVAHRQRFAAAIPTLP